METDEECWNDAFLHRGDEIIPLPEGGEVVLDVLKIPVFNEDKSRKNLIILGRDVSKRREAEEGLIAAKIKAEESDKLKSEFLATMSHELRTPLNSVIGFSDLIESDEDVEEIHDFTRIINNNARSLLNLIEDLFDISLIESEQMKIELAEMDMITTIKEVYEIFPLEIHKLDKLDIKFSLDINVEHFVITSDSYRIKQVVTNLVRNALKFTEEGQISISFDYDDREVRVVVSDTGIGMEDDKLQTIFERFRQIEDGASRQYGGAGLGLAISKKIALLLGGDIMVSSQKGVGSKFILSLPRSL
jgi:signal transduction histidine kinase